MVDMIRIGRQTPVARTEAGLTQYSWDDRGLLRTANPASGDYAIVEGLGMFRYYPGSTEPDDDESCFATSSGRWLIELVTWDFIQAWDLPWRDYVEARLITVVEYDNRGSLRIVGSDGDLILVNGLGLFEYVNGSTEIDDDETCFASASGTGAWEIRAVSWEVVDNLVADATSDVILTTFYNQQISSLSGGQSTTFDVGVGGAVVGDTVVIGLSGDPSSGMIVAGWVSVTGVVTVRLTNITAGGVAVPTGNWSITVIKST